jgi:hypothetical protein
MKPGARVAVTTSMMFAACLPSEDRPARWSYIHAAIIEPSCATAGCHSALTAIAGPNLSGNEGAYNILTGHVCGEPLLPEAPPGNHVIPFAADYSTLIYQLRGVDPEGRPYRDVMPPDTPLPDVEVELVARWIDEGAACD